MEGTANSSSSRRHAASSIGDKGKKLVTDMSTGIMAGYLASTVLVVSEKAIGDAAREKSRFRYVFALCKRLGSAVVSPIRSLAHSENRMVYGVVCGLYAATNVIQSVCEMNDKDSKEAKFIGATAALLAVQLGFEFNKLANRHDGRAKITKYVAASVVRDSATAASAFLLPPYVAKYLQERYPLMKNEKVAFYTAQILTPVAAQLIISPFHTITVFILDKEVQAQQEPVKKSNIIIRGFRGIRTGYRLIRSIGDTMGRCHRALFAYGVAGVLNFAIHDNVKHIFAFE